MLPLTEAELDELEEFLISDKTPENCLDISGLDGFLHAVLIGPTTLMPSRWMPEIWNEADDDEMVWDSMEQANRITGIIMRLYNTIAQSFQCDPPDIDPLFYHREVKGEEITIIDEWCFGFMHAVHMCFDDWKPLIDSDEHRHLLTPIFLHGTEPGWEELESSPKLAEVKHEDWIAAMPLAVRDIYEFWLPYRRGEIKRVVGSREKVGRNSPCPCGSGKKFKKCCGAADRTH